MGTKLDVKKWSVASLAVFIIMTIVAWILTNLGIAPWAAGTASVSAAVAVQHDPMTQRILIYLSRISFACLFTFVFTKGYEGKPGLGEGIRYGCWAGLLVYLPAILIGLATSDLPTSSQINLLVKGILEAIICGAVIGQLYRPSKA